VDADDCAERHCGVDCADVLFVGVHGAAGLAAVARAARRAVLAYFFLDERLTAVQLAGSLLILGAVVLLRIHEGRLAGQPTAGAETVNYY